MAFEFLGAGQYQVILGKSFDAKPKKKAPKYFNVKNRDSLDSSGYGNEAKLEKKKDRYQVEMKHTHGPNVVYDAEVTTEEEYNCILIYNEEKKTITLERQSAQINLTRRKQVEPPQQQQQQQNGHLGHSPLPGNQYTMIQTPPIINHVIKEAKVEPMDLDIEPIVGGGDDFDFDISKDMDEILGSDEEGSDTFEEIAAPILVNSINGVASPLSLPVTPFLPPSSPNIPLNLALPSTPSTVHASPTSSSPSTTTAAKKRKFKMASAPIRHPGIVSPAAATVTPPPTTTTPNKLVGNKRPKNGQDDSSSSSGSEDESSSGSESGSTETGSSSEESESESGASDSDDDFESLAQDISMSLSKGGLSAPGSPSNNYKPTPGNTPTPSSQQQNNGSGSGGSGGSGGGAAGPMSLRALFKEDDEEESLSSSDDDN